jgi:hypothetical protein
MVTTIDGRITPSGRGRTGRVRGSTELGTVASERCRVGVQE